MNSLLLGKIPSTTKNLTLSACIDAKISRWSFMSFKYFISSAVLLLLFEALVIKATYSSGTNFIVLFDGTSN